jgi:hypothetical protein
MDEPEPSRATREPAMDQPETSPNQPRGHRGELISALSALVLLLLMFLTEWYGIAGGAGRSATRSGLTSAENAWHGLTVLRWLMLLTVALAIGSVILRASQSSHGTQTDTSRLLTALGTLTAVLVAYRVLINLPAPDRVMDQKLGAVLGVLSAFGIALGGYESIREQRKSSRVVVHRPVRRGPVASSA